jgi:hypothetical protein
MIRVFDFRMEGSDEVIRLASMSEGIAKRYVEKSREMLKQQQELPLDVWLDRRNATILESMKRAGTESSPEFLSEFDIPTLDAMLIFILEKSGLRATTSEGESKAVLISETSKAA